MTDKTGNNGRKMLRLKYLSNFWRTLEMSLFNCKIDIFLTWSEKCIIVTGDYGNYVNSKSKFEITDTKLYVPVVTLSTEDNKNYCNN